MPSPFLLAERIEKNKAGGLNNNERNISIKKLNHYNEQASVFPAIAYTKSLKIMTVRMEARSGVGSCYAIENRSPHTCLFQQDMFLGLN